MITVKDCYEGNDPAEIEKWEGILKQNCPTCGKPFSEHTLEGEGGMSSYRYNDNVKLICPAKEEEKSNG